jgi:defect-in-organelle-trafficking protein DotC
MMDMPQTVTLQDVMTLYEKPAFVQSDQTALAEYRKSIATAREQGVFDEAVRIAVSAGLAYQIGNIKKAVDAQSRELDTIYNFAPLMISGRVVPPVISESRDIYTQDGEQTLRLSGVRYEIVSQARFSSTPPNWRAYLTLPEPSTDFVIGVRPQNEAEQKIWRYASRIAWNEGINQANAMLDRATDKLNRDFTGMVRYRTMLAENRVTAPLIATQDIPVTKEGSALVIDDTLLRITALPDFKVNMKEVGSTIVGSSYGGLSPAAARLQENLPDPLPAKSTLADRIIQPATAPASTTNGKKKK